MGECSCLATGRNCTLPDEQKLGLHIGPEGICYFTKNRVFAIRLTEDSHGAVPCFALGGFRDNPIGN